MLNYVPSLATILLALMQLAKDWGAHQSTWRRALVLVAIMFLGVGSVINTYYSSRKVAAQHLEDQKQISGLKKAVETASTDQEKNTKVFVKSFDDMTQKLNGLETQLKTAGLQKEAEGLRADLKATQKAMLVPKAELEATLGEPTATLDNLSIKEVSVAQSLDGVVEFTVNVVNKSVVQAKNGSIFLRICNKCEFVEEPKRFTKIVSASDYDREMVFQAINATTAVGIPLKIKPPPMKRRFEVAVLVRCDNCVVRPKDSLFVHY